MCDFLHVRLVEQQMQQWTITLSTKSEEVLRGYGLTDLRVTISLPAMEFSQWVYLN